MPDAMSATTTAMQPVLGPLVDGDLCDIRVGRGICGQDAERLVLDADGRERFLCPACVRLYFPAGAVAA